MTNSNQRETLRRHGFALIESSHYGIYQHEVFENADIKFILILDKAFHECQIYSKHDPKRSGPILEIVRAIRKEENYLVDELSRRHPTDRLNPDVAIRILIENDKAIEEWGKSEE